MRLMNVKRARDELSSVNIVSSLSWASVGEWLRTVVEVSVGDRQYLPARMQRLTFVLRLARINDELCLVRPVIWVDEGKGELDGRLAACCLFAPSTDSAAKLFVEAK